jgi:hypothetical protein
MNRRKEIIQQTFAAVDRLLRPASIAQVGGFRPPPAPVTSWFGGQFFGLPEERWPESRGRPMAPVLQIRTDELPFCPQALAPAALLTLFVDPAELPVDTVNGDGWCIRTYATLNDLTPLPAISMPFRVKPFPVRWTLSTNEAPQRELVADILDSVGFHQLEHDIELYSQRYQRYPGTKVGGWPSYIQGAPSIAAEFVFQVGTEPKAHWAWGDSGIGYFFRLPSGEWSMYWDCY